jgi:hypothetical protein
MALDRIWFVTEDISARYWNPNQTNTTLIPLPTDKVPRLVYAFPVITRLRHKQSAVWVNTNYPVDFDGACWVDSYVQNGNVQTADAAAIFESNVTEVVFERRLYAGPNAGESDMAVIYQIFEWN